MKLKPHVFIIGVALSLLCCPAFISADTICQGRAENVLNSVG